MLAFCFISSIWSALAFWVLPLFSWFYGNSKHALGWKHADSFSSPAVQLLVICTVHLMPVRNKLSGCSPAVFARLFWLPIQQDYTRANKNADNWCLHAQRFTRSRSWTTGMKQGEGFYWWIASKTENYYQNKTLWMYRYNRGRYASVPSVPCHNKESRCGAWDDFKTTVCTHYLPWKGQRFIWNLLFLSTGADTSHEAERGLRRRTSVMGNWGHLLLELVMQKSCCLWRARTKVVTDVEVVGEGASEHKLSPECNIKKRLTGPVGFNT